MLLTNQFLQVELIVHKDDQAKFEHLVKLFLANNGFDRFDKDSSKHLVLALRTPDPVAYGGYRQRQSKELCAVRDEFVTLRNGEQIPADENSFYRYVHLWRLGQVSDLDLARLMQLSADDSQYRAIDDLVIRETQDVVFRVPWIVSQLPALAATGPIRVARITRQLATRELGTYLFGLGALVPKLETQGFETMGCFQNITGLLNTVTEYWKTDVPSLAALQRTPAEVTKAVFGNSPQEKGILSLHRKVTLSQELFQSYLATDHLNVELVGRRWAPRSMAAVAEETG
ncbi:MAG: hypothetical protein WDO69_14375 [Pseudomonadota bacterium]